MATNKNFENLIKKFLGSQSNISQIFIKNELTLTNYKEFWDSLSYENGVVYLRELVIQIINNEQNKSKQTTRYTIENLLATFFDNDKKKKDNLFDAKTLWDEHLSEKQSAKRINPSPYSNQILSVMSIEDLGENAFLSNLVGCICFIPEDIIKQKYDSQLIQNQDLFKQLQIYYQNINDYNKNILYSDQPYYSGLILEETELMETGELSFGYEYLLNYLKRKKKQYFPKNIFDIIKHYLKILPQISQEFSDQAEKSLSSLLHLTKQILTFFGSNEIEAIRSLLAQIQLFRRWPYPVGTLASEVVQLLFSECKNTGNAFRYKIREEVPIVDFQNYAQQDQLQQDQQEEQKEIILNKSLKQDEKLYNQSLKQDEKLYKAYVICDEDHSEAAYLLYYGQEQYNRNSVKNSHILRCVQIVSMLNMININQNDFKVTISEIANLSNNSVFLLYCRLLHVIEKCEELDSNMDIKVIQESSFQELIQEIKNMEKNISLTNINEEIMTILLDNPETYICEFPVPFLEPLNKFNTSTNFLTKTQTILQINDQQQFHNSQSQLNLLQQKFQSFYRVKELIQEINQQNLPLHSEPLKFIIMGGDVELHHLTQELGEIFDKNPQLFQTLDLRIYLAPIKKSCLAHFIAAKDHWYQRYLYYPLSQDLLLPKFENLETKNNEQWNWKQENKNILLPYELKLNCIFTYLREANRIYNVKVYKIECDYDNADDNIQQTQNQQQVNIQILKNQNQQQQQNSRIIYFSQYLMLGASVECENYKLFPQLNKKVNLDNLNLYDMKERKTIIYFIDIIKFQSMNMILQVKSIDFMGNIQGYEDTKEPIQIHNLKLNNVYKEYFEGNMPYPNSNWLELTFITYENSKLFDANLKQKTNFKKYDRNQLQSAFKALHSSFPVRSLTLQEQYNKPFDIFVDGKIIRNLTKISVSPVENSNIQEGFQLKLPIMTFLPLKL